MLHDAIKVYSKHTNAKLGKYAKARTTMVERMRPLLGLCSCTRSCLVALRTGSYYMQFSESRKCHYIIATTVVIGRIVGGSEKIMVVRGL